MAACEEGSTSLDLPTLSLDRRNLRKSKEFAGSDAALEMKNEELAAEVQELTVTNAQLAEDNIRLSSPAVEERKGNSRLGVTMEHCLSKNAFKSDRTVSNPL